MSLTAVVRLQAMLPMIPCSCMQPSTPYGSSVEFQICKQLQRRYRMSVIAALIYASLKGFQIRGLYKAKPYIIVNVLKPDWTWQ